MGTLPALAGIDGGVLLYAGVVVFGAALVRGYSGFGFSALAVAALTLVLEPVAVVPLVLLLEAAASLQLLAAVHRDVDWRQMGWLLGSAALAMPFGTWLLASLPTPPMRALISAAILVVSLLIWLHPGRRLGAGRTAIVPAGLVSGALNGAAALGGLPLVLYFLATSIEAASMRAMVIVYLLFAGLYGSAAAALGGLLGQRTLILAGLMLLPLIAGNAIGDRRFRRAEPASFRRFALLILSLLAAIGLIRAVG